MKSTPQLVLNILKEYSDKDHPLSCNAIIKKIKDCYGVGISRNTVLKYIRDIQINEEVFNFFIRKKSNLGYYYEIESSNQATVIMLDDMISNDKRYNEATKNVLRENLLLMSGFSSKKVKELVGNNSNENIFKNMNEIISAKNHKKLVSLVLKKFDREIIVYPCEIFKTDNNHSNSFHFKAIYWNGDWFESRKIYFNDVLAAKKKE